MEQFSYSFALSMLHSLWQLPVLLAFYFIITFSFPDFPALLKRNFLFAVAFTQFLVSILTFAILFSSTSFLDLTSFSGIEKLLPVSTSWLHYYGEWLFYGYFIIISIKSVSFIFQWSLLSKRSSVDLTRPHAELRLFVSSKACHFGISKKITLWYSNTITSPVTFGFFKPVILLPVALVNGLSVKETEALIIHELAHLKNNDYLLNWFLIAIETIFFFNPFIYIMVSNIRLEREKSCDLQVLDFNYCKIAYANALLQTARFEQKNRIFHMAAVSGRAHLLKRILYFSRNDHKAGKRKSLLNLTYLGLIAFIAANGLIFGIPSTIISAERPITVQVDNSRFIEKPEKPTIVTAAVVTSTSAGRNLGRRKSKEFATLIEPVSKVSDNLNADQAQPDFKTVPVALQMAGAAGQEQDVIVNEENTAGKKITKAYRVKFRDGRWSAETLWIVAENSSPVIQKDSLTIRPDTVHRLIPVFQ